MKRVFLGVFFVCVVAILWACDMGAVEAKGLEDEETTVVLLPGFTAELLDATDEVSAFIDEELGITGPFWADEELPLAEESAAELVASS